MNTGIHYQLVPINWCMWISPCVSCTCSATCEALEIGCGWGRRDLCSESKERLPGWSTDNKWRGCHLWAGSALRVQAQCPVGPQNTNMQWYLFCRLLEGVSLQNQLPTGSPANRPGVLEVPALPSRDSGDRLLALASSQITTIVKMELNRPVEVATLLWKNSRALIGHHSLR